MYSDRAVKAQSCPLSTTALFAGSQNRNAASHLARKGTKQWTMNLNVTRCLPSGTGGMLRGEG